MPKGHSLLEPRITALEEYVSILQTQLSLAESRLAALEKLFAPMSTGTQPDQFVMKDRYQPIFERWPGNGSQT